MKGPGRSTAAADPPLVRSRPARSHSRVSAGAAPSARLMKLPDPKSERQTHRLFDGNVEPCARPHRSDRRRRPANRPLAAPRTRSTHTRDDVRAYGMLYDAAFGSRARRFSRRLGPLRNQAPNAGHLLKRKPRLPVIFTTQQSDCNIAPDLWEASGCCRHGGFNGTTPSSA